MRKPILLAIVISLSIAFALFVNKTDNTLPDVSHIKSITIEFYHREENKDVKFIATPEDWVAIRAALLPLKEDPAPTKWEHLGDINIEKTDSKSFYVGFSNRGEPNAFTAGETFEKRIYYLGGNGDKLFKALYAAYERSKK